MPNYTFGSDTIVDLPNTGTTTFAGLTDAPYTFNPFGSVTAFNDGGAAGSTIRLIFTNSTGGVDGETLYSVAGGVTTATALGGSVVFVASSAPEMLTWLQNVYVVDNSLNDRFTITLRGTDGGTNGQNRTFSYRLACFVAGTEIQTPSGAQPVETLQIGDLVTTLDGTAKQVKWVGHRTYEAAYGAAEAFVRPVLFTAGSLGNNLPSRDLRVSPQHAMLVDGVMVPAAALVNGVSIRRDTVEADVQYFHIELDGHEVVFAEGAASETFVDANSRAMFDNADEYGLLYGTYETVAATQARVDEGYQLAAIRNRLAELAGIADVQRASGALRGNVERIENGVLHGWVVDAANPGHAVEAEVLVEGEVVARIIANRYRADLDQAGLANGNCAFTVSLAASVTSLGQVAVRRATDGAVLTGAMIDYAIV